MADTLKYNTPVINANGDMVTLADLAGGGGLPAGWAKGKVTYNTDTNVLTITHNLNASNYIFYILNNAFDKTESIVFEFMIVKDGNSSNAGALVGNGDNFIILDVSNAYNISVSDNAISLDGTDNVQFKPFNGTYTWLAIPYT